MPEPEKGEAEVDKQSTQAENPIIAPTVGQLQEVVQKLTTDLEAARREAKSHQDYGRKTKEELDRQRGLDTKISAVETRLDVVTEMLANLVDREDSDEPIEQPKKRRSEEYLGRLKQVKPEINLQQQEFVRIAEEADRLAKSVGLDMEHSPELKSAFRLFRTGMAGGFYPGDAQDAMEEVQKVVAQKKEPTEAKVDIEKLVEEKAHKMLEERGLLKTDIGISSSGVGQRWTMSEVQAMPQFEYQKNFPNGFIDVIQAQREGKIK